MYCIGIISKDIELINSISKYGKTIILNKENIKKHLEENWDILLIEDILDNKYIEILGNNSKYIIINDLLELDIRLNRNVNIITYGFNYKSTVTVSSNSEENLVICIQRAINGIHGKEIEQQEIIIQNDKEKEANQKIIEKIIQELLEK